MISLLASGGLETFVEEVATGTPIASPTAINLLIEPVAQEGLVWWVWGLVILGGLVLVYLVTRGLSKKKV